MPNSSTGTKAPVRVDSGQEERVGDERANQETDGNVGRVKNIEQITAESPADR